MEKRWIHIPHKNTAAIADVAAKIVNADALAARYLPGMTMINADEYFCCTAVFRVARALKINNLIQLYLLYIQFQH